MSARTQAFLIRRYLWLYETLTSRQPISLREIADRWDACPWGDGSPLSRKTFDNHCNAIEELFDVSIECGKGYKYSINHLGNEHEKVNRILTNALSFNNFLSSPERAANVSLEPTDGKPELISTIFEAIEGERELVLEYRHNYDPSRQEKLVVKPVGIKQFRQRWYLVAELPDGSAYSYPLDRVVSLSLGDKCTPSALRLYELFADTFGIIREVDKPAEVILIKVEKEQARYFKSVPLHSSQEIVEDTELFTIFSLYLSPTYDFTMELLSHGSRLEVLAPASLRTTLRARALDLANLYK